MVVLPFFFGAFVGIASWLFPRTLSLLRGLGSRRSPWTPSQTRSLQELGSASAHIRSAGWRGGALATSEHTFSWELGHVSGPETHKVLEGETARVTSSCKRSTRKAEPWAQMGGADKRQTRSGTATMGGCGLSTRWIWVPILPCVVKGQENDVPVTR